MKVLDVGDFDAYAAVVGGDGEWDVSNLSDGPDLGHRASIRVD